MSMRSSFALMPKHSSFVLIYKRSSSAMIARCTLSQAAS